MSSVWIKAQHPSSLSLFRKCQMSHKFDEYQNPRKCFALFGKNRDGNYDTASTYVSEMCVVKQSSCGVTSANRYFVRLPCEIRIFDDYEMVSFRDVRI